MESFQLGQRDLGFLAAGSLKAEVSLRDGDGGVAEQAFVDVADLFDVDVAERDSACLATFEDSLLHRAQRVQHHPIRHRDRQGSVRGERGQEREAGRVEQGAAVGGHPHVLERRATVERLAGRQ